MTATIHTLHPELASRLGPNSPAAQILQGLEQMALAVINEQLRVMFESADDLLFEMADKAKKGAEQQLFLDTMRIVRLERPRILKSFQAALHEAFGRSGTEHQATDVNLDDLEHWSLQESTDLEEKIAVSNMDSKASNLYASELLELEQRLTRLSDDTGGVVSSKALCPIRILEAFQQSMKGLEVEFPIKLVIYKLFDRVVVSNLGRVFKDANQLLETNGITPRQTGKPKKKPAPPPSSYFGNPGTPAGAPSAAGAGSAGQDFSMTMAMQPYLYPSQGAAAAGSSAAPGHYIEGVDTRRLAEALTSYGGAPQAFGPMAASPAGYGMAPPGMGSDHGVAGPGYGNAQLASEMLAVIEGVGQGRPVSSWMPAQNLALVGRMFDDFYNDPRLPEAARPLLGKLQFPAMKVALSDPSFFANPDHPVRALTHDVFNMLTGVRNAAHADYQRLEQLIQDLLKRFDPDPAKLRQSARETQAVSEDQAEQFLAQQRERLDAQRKSMKEKVRRIVSQEIRLHIGDRYVPKAVMPLLLSGFAPVLAVAYLRGGQSDAAWQDTLKLLDVVLDSLNPAGISKEGRAQREVEIVAAVSQRLQSVGHPEEKVKTLTSGLLEAYVSLASLGAADRSKPSSITMEMVVPSVHAPAPVSDAAPALPMLLRPGEWFRVWDAEKRFCHWLKLTSYHPAVDTVLFEDFGGENHLKMRATAFVHDLAAGRSTPVDPESSTMQLISLLPPPPAKPIASGAVWHKAPSHPVP